IFLYELLYGRSPFRGRNRQRTFTNVLTKDLAFPANPPVSDEAKDLMRKLLQRDPADRLGAKHGAIEIRSHPFFKSIEWPLIRDMVSMSSLNSVSLTLPHTHTCSHPSPLVHNAIKI
ncbi:unnamed protein product, partial [Closterium sp. NIES-54]